MFESYNILHYNDYFIIFSKIQVGQYLEKYFQAHGSEKYSQIFDEWMNEKLSHLSFLGHLYTNKRDLK